MSGNRIHVRTALATVASAVAVLTLAAPALAASPTVQEQHIVRSLVAGECDDHLVIADFDFMRTLTTFYDNDGVVVRQVIHAQLSGTVRDTVTGAALPVMGVRNVLLSGSGQLVRSTGTNVHVVVPGLGTVQIGAGNFGFDDEGNYFEHGRLDPPITARLCEALAV